MLRDVTLTLLLLGALSASFGREYKTASAFIIVAVLTHFLARKAHNHSAKAEKELNIVATKTLHITLASIGLVAIIALLSDLRPDYALLIIASVIAACTPNSLFVVFHKKLVRKAEHANYRSFQKIGRTALSTSAASLALVVVSVFGLALFHILPAVNAVQLLLLEIAVLAIPLVALHKDSGKKTKLEAAHIEHGTLTDRSALGNFVGFGILAATLTYVSYLLFFVRINLAPGYLDPTLPQYHQATTVSLVTLALCCWSYLLFERAHTHHKFFTEHLTSNPKLLKSFGLSIVLLCLVIYVPTFQTYFSTDRLTAADWASAVFFAGVYSLARLAQRYTRHHSRGSVLKAHKV